ncbi:MAG: UDP-N-acetylmuramate--L-alanine ligase [Microgenomates group bacterium]
MKKPEFLKKIKHVHFTGIKGVGMTALACCLQDLGIKISGSDIEEIFVTDKVLKQRKIPWKVGFSEKNLTPKPDLVITTGAHGGLTNPEVVAATEMKIPVLTHAQALGKMMEGKEGISVCGVGGKTTTASMIATVLEKAGRKPSYAIGVGEIFPLGAPGKYSNGLEFVAEADEYANSPGTDNRPRFSFQNPKIIVVTNIEYDHPDVYRDLNHTKEVFSDFFKKIPKDGLLVACADNKNTLGVAKKFPKVLQTYGFSPQADWQITKTYFGQGQTIFRLQHRGVVIDEIKIRVPGRFNILNATAAFAVGTFLGINAQTIKKGLEEFWGTKRRFEFVGAVRGVRVYDDYAHHPTEIRQVLLAAKQWFPQERILVVFQPHTYSRTKALFSEFSRAFAGTNIVIITEIYASAREKDDLGINGKMLAEETAKHHPRVVYEPGEKGVVEFLRKETQPGDVIITMGAGSIFLWHKNILKSLKN